MSRTTQFAFANTSDGTAVLTKKNLGLLSNYALSQDSANMAVLNNKTAPIDAQELISYRTIDIKDVKSSLNIQHPAPVKAGIQYSVQVEDTLRTTDTTDTSFQVDEPIVVNISVRHNKSGNITGTHVASAFLRAVSALMKDDGTFRFDDLMRSAERPVIE